MVVPNLDVKASEVLSSDRLVVEGSCLVPLSSVTKDGDQMLFRTVDNEHFSFHQDEICRVYRPSIEGTSGDIIFPIALVLVIIFGLLVFWRIMVLLF